MNRAFKVILIGVLAGIQHGVLW